MKARSARSSPAPRAAAASTSARSSGRPLARHAASSLNMRDAAPDAGTKDSQRPSTAAACPRPASSTARGPGTGSMPSPRVGGPEEPDRQRRRGQQRELAPGLFGRDAAGGELDQVGGLEVGHGGGGDGLAAR